MLNKRFTSALLGALVLLVVTWANSFSQELPTENLSFTTQVASPTDTHCVAKPGDTNGDNIVSLADILAYIPCIFKGGSPVPCPFKPQCRGDANGDGRITLKDIVYLINYLFRGGPAPVKSGVCCL